MIVTKLKLDPMTNQACSGVCSAIGSAKVRFGLMILI
jgi:hypothetical protein